MIFLCRANCSEDWLYYFPFISFTHVKKPHGGKHRHAVDSIKLWTRTNNISVAEVSRNCLRVNAKRTCIAMVTWWDMTDCHFALDYAGGIIDAVRIFAVNGRVAVVIQLVVAGHFRILCGCAWFCITYAPGTVRGTDNITWVLADAGADSAGIAHVEAFVDGAVTVVVDTVAKLSGAGVDVGIVVVAIHRSTVPTFYIIGVTIVVGAGLAVGSSAAVIRIGAVG